MPLLCSAQDLTTEVVVDRTVAVDLPSASPLAEVMPALSLPAVTNPGLHTSDYTLTADFTPTVSTGNAGTYTGLTLPYGYRGFAWLGYFPAYNLGAGIGYSLLNDSINKLDLSAAFEGASWKGEDINGTSPTQRYNTFDIKAGYTHIFRNSTILRAYADYGHDALRMPYDSYVDGNDAPQDFNRGNFGVSVAQDGEVSYSAHAFYRFFNVGKDITVASPAMIPQKLSGAGESMYGIDGSISAELKSKSKIYLGIRAVNQNVDGWYPGWGTIYSIDKNIWLLGLNPTFSFPIKAFDIRLGIHVDMSNNGAGFGFRAAPDLGFVWHTSKWFEVYADADGGDYFNSLYNAYDYSIFAPEYAVYDLMTIRIDAKAGIRTASFAGFSADLHVGYSDANDVAMPSISVMNGDWTTRGFVNRDVSGWSAGVTLDYSYRDILKAKVDAELYSHNRGKGYWQNLDNARAVLNAEVEVKATDRLTVGASYRLRSDRFAFYNILSYSEYRLGSVSDFGLRGTYLFDRQLSFFARIDNLFCHRYQILPGIRSQGIHGLVGVTYLF